MFNIGFDFDSFTNSCHRIFPGSLHIPFFFFCYFLANLPAIGESGFKSRQDIVFSFHKNINNILVRAAQIAMHKLCSVPWYQLQTKSSNSSSLQSEYVDGYDLHISNLYTRHISARKGMPLFIFISRTQLL